MRTRAMHWFCGALLVLAVVLAASWKDAPAGLKRAEAPPVQRPLAEGQQRLAQPENVQTAGLPEILGLLPGAAGPGRVAHLDPPQCVPLEIAAAWLNGEAFASLNRLRTAHLHLTHEGDRLCVRAVWMGGP